MGEFVRVETEGAVGVIRLDRPKMNALNVQVQRELHEAAEQAGADDAIRAVVIWGGERVYAAGALAIGLVDRVVPAAEVYKTALEWAAGFADGPALALKAAKEAVNRGLEVDLTTGLEIERLQFSGTFATEDRAEGMRAFVA